MFIRLCSLLTLLPIAAGQTPTVVLETGDPFPGSGDVEFIHEVAVNDSGDWLVAVGVDVPSAQPDRGLLSSNGVVLSPGQSIGPLAGTLVEIKSIGLSGLGEPLAVLRMAGLTPSEDEGLYRGAVPLLIEGGQVPGMPPATAYAQLFGVRVSGAHVQLCANVLFTGAASASSTLLSYPLAAGLGAPTPVAVEGDTLPDGSGTFALVRPDHGAGGAFDSIFGALTSVGERVYLNDVLLAEVGGSSPVPGRAWAASLSTVRCDVNVFGEHAYVARLDGDSASNVLLVRNGAKLVQTGDSLPAIAPFVLTRLTPGSFGEKDAVWITDAGAVLWGAEWSDTDDNHGLFLDDRLVAWEGMAVGARTISALWPEYTVSPNGRWLLFTAGLSAPGQQSVVAVLRVDLAEGANYCGPAVPNSTGAPATIFATAGRVAAGEPLLLTAQSMPPGEVGYFLTSLTQGFTSTPGGSSGVLCIGGTIGRFASSPEVVGAAGSFSTLVDTNALPVWPLQPVLAGETWMFQAWFTDFNLVPTSNFSDGLAVSF